METTTRIGIRSRKDAAITFLELASSGRVEEAWQHFVALRFRHHNPYFRGNGDSLALGMKEAHTNDPNHAFEVQQAIEEGDRVAVHSRVRKATGPEITVVHIFRFEGDRIAELWDIAQQGPESSPNENGMF
jgi:predicted SnoaL-like aldol condensation-catalyzing enzyme